MVERVQNPGIEIFLIYLGSGKGKMLGGSRTRCTCNHQNKKVHTFPFCSKQALLVCYYCEWARVIFLQDGLAMEVPSMWRVGCLCGAPSVGWCTEKHAQSSLGTVACPLGSVQRCGQHEGRCTQPKNFSEAYYDSWVLVVLYSLHTYTLLTLSRS